MGLRNISLMILIMLVASNMLSTVKSIRMGSVMMRDKNKFGSLFGTQLPKGLVPPSGPSPCHNNNLDSIMTQRQFYSFPHPPPPDFVLCP